MAHLIETYADFRRRLLVNHWLRSLKENVDLRDVDILVHDYGLTDAQVKQLRELGARRSPRSRRPHVQHPLP